MANQEKLIEAKVCKISNLLNGNKNLEIPNFQRPYEWGKEQVELLIEDLLEAYKENKKNYLIGNMVFYKENENYGKLEVIDGQQRITTLGLILYVLENKENNFVQLEVDSTHSTKNIISNYEIIKNKFKNYNDKDKKLSEFIKDNVIITALITNDLDQAFFLFDSQNTRGEPLKRKDLLKVHHIRGVENDKEKELLIKNYWEKYERFKGEYKTFDLLEELLQLLSIPRKALRGELEGNDLVEVDVYKEFFAEVKKEDNNKLNNYNQPSLFEYFTYDIRTETVEFLAKNFSMTYPHYKILNSWKFLPFEIPQSIEEGEKFFYYLIKYINTYKELSKNYSDIFSLFDGLWHSGNIFLNKVYKSLLLLYYDKFGEESLKDFAYRLIIIFTHYSFEKKQIRKEGVVNSFAKPYPEKVNLYNLIFSKYYPVLVKKELDKFIQFEISDEIKDSNEKIGEKLVKLKEQAHTRSGSFVVRWYENDEMKGKVFEVLKSCGRDWEVEEKKKNGQ